MSDPAVDHWQGVYTDKAPEQVSWFEDLPEQSVHMIDAAGIDTGAAIIDVGGGASRLAGRLLAAGYTDLTVTDISAAALAQARHDLGSRAGAIEWVVADIRRHDFGRRFDLWHDRAVFHFMVDPEDRRSYLDVLLASTRPGSHVVLATFGPAGPEQCSGLPVARYDAEALARVLGEDFSLQTSTVADHETPSGRSQQFVYALFRRGS